MLSSALARVRASISSNSIVSSSLMASEVMHYMSHKMGINGMGLYLPYVPQRMKRNK